MFARRPIYHNNNINNNKITINSNLRLRTA